MKDQALQFLSALFSEVEEGYICAWRRDTKMTTRIPVRQLKRAAKLVLSVGEKTDVYIGCGIQPKNGPPEERGKAATVSVIPGAWADIDVGDHGNGKTYLPTVEAALAYLDTLPIKPTLVVSTGGGVHAWWLFEEPLVIETDEDREAATQIVGRWQMLLRRHLGQYDLDSTYDLARVLRIPGTYNHKGDAEPLPVNLLIDDGPRTNPSDLLEFAPDEMVAITDSMKGDAGGRAASIVIRPDADPPADKLIALISNNDKAADTWNRNRDDFAKGDYSPSTYCASLAAFAVAANWSDQEIAALLIAWRRKHCPESLKLDRPGWYMKVIEKARSLTGKTENRAAAIETIVEAAEGDEVPERDVLRSLSELLGFRVLGFIKRVIRDSSGFVEAPTYVLDIQVGSKEPTKIVLESSRVLLDQGRFHQLAFDVADVAIPRMKGPEWQRVVQAFGRIVVEIEDVPEAGVLESVRSLLRRYIAEVQPSSDLVEAVKADCVYKAQDGSLQFPWTGFSTWVATSRMARIGNADLSRALKEIGCKRVAYDRKGREYPNGRLKTTFWQIPKEM